MLTVINQFLFIKKLFYEKYETTPLNNLTSECNYGGRIIDNIDRLLISSLLKKFYSPDILTNEPYRFCEIDDYFIPGYSSYNEYINYITRLPLSVEPEVIGLHNNAIMLRNYQDSQQLIDSIFYTLPQRSRKALIRFKRSSTSYAIVYLLKLMSWI